MMDDMLHLEEELKVVRLLTIRTADESHVLLKVPRKNNMYSFVMKNIVPQKDLTCLLAKATNDESMLWHRRLGHINFKNINKLVKENLVRGIKKEYSMARTPQQNRVTERRNKTLIEAARTILADSKLPTTFFVEGVNTACYVQNRVLVVKPHFKTHYELFRGGGPEWLFDIDSLSESINYAPVPAERPNAECSTKNVNTVGPSINTTNANDNTGSLNINIVSPPVNTATPTYADYPSDPLMPDLEDTGIFDDAYDDKDEGVEADYNNLETAISVSHIPSTCVHKDHPKEQIISEMEPKKETQALDDESWVEAMQEELLQFKLLNVWTLVDLPHEKEPLEPNESLETREIREGLLLEIKPGWIESIMLFLAYASFMDFTVYQIDVKSAFLYGTIKEEVYVSQPYPKFPDRVYKVEKALYGLHQALRAWPDIMFAVRACSRFQVQPKVSHMHAVMIIFRYLKGQPTLGLWYPKDSPLELIAYFDSDYACASLDRKSTIGGCQFLGSRLISWQCKKQTIVANSTTEVEYIDKKELAIPGQTKTDLKFVDQHNMVAYLEKNDDNTTSHQIVNFLSSCSINYALTQIHDIVDGKAVVISESSVRSDLLFDDEDGITCLTNDEIFKNLALMGYEQLSTKLTFQKGIDTCGSPRRQETMGGTPARTRPERVLEQPNEPPHSKGHTSGNQREEDVDKSDQTQDIDWNDPEVLRYHALQNRVFSKAKVRKNMYTYLKNQGGYKQSYFKRMKYEDIRPIFERAWDQIHTFVPKDFEIEKEVMKRSEFNLQQESLTKQKLDEQTKEEVKAQANTDQEVKEMKLYMKIVPDEEITIDAIPLATKPPMIVEYKIVKEGKISTYHIIRADGSTKRYTLMINLLKNIDREDLETLWKLVKDKHGNTRPEEDYERVL
uniref:Ribonuclease H-like domain-containing protein n=1 Tax=Tanacetum cinerariifolium TaxID=118510 RepID=A0A6L2N6I4_TANCI|nr:ribonuclease H-like domain-containing protein [Tanacetum cinerariifolium]